MKTLKLSQFFSVFAAMLVALGLLTWSSRSAFAADHREAPIVDGIPEGDITDVYVFTDPNDSSHVVFIMNVNPFSVPAEASSYSLSPDLLYQFKIDNTNDAREDVVIQVVVNKRGTGQTFQVFGPARPSHTGARNTLLRGDASVTGTFGQVKQSGDGLIKAFVGLRDDPFVFDVGQFFRILNGTQDVFRQIGTSFRGRAVRADGTSGVDGFGGFNVTTIAVSVPKSMVRGQKSKINVWATVSERVSGGAPHSASKGKGHDDDDDEDDDHPRAHYQQFERMGQQVFATVFIPKVDPKDPNASPRDAENAEIPEHDMANYSALIPDALTTTDNDGSGNTIQNRANLLTTLGLTATPNGAPLLIPGDFANTDKHLLRKALLPDVLRFDLDDDKQDIGQFGLQNGRRLQDPSVDIAVQLLRSLADVHFPNGVFGGGPSRGLTGDRVALECSAFPACQDRRVLVVVQGTTFNKPDGQLINFTVVGNDVPFSNTFPYLASPHPLPGEDGTVGFPPQQ